MSLSFINYSTSLPVDFSMFAIVRCCKHLPFHVNALVSECGELWLVSDTRLQTHPGYVDLTSQHRPLLSNTDQVLFVMPLNKEAVMYFSLWGPDVVTRLSNLQQREHYWTQAGLYLHSFVCSCLVLDSILIPLFSYKKMHRHQPEITWFCQPKAAMARLPFKNTRCWSP